MVIYNDSGKVSRRKLKKIRNAARSVSLRSKLHYAGDGTAVNGSGGIFYHGGVFARQGGQDRQRTGFVYHFLQKHFRFWQKIGIFLKNYKKIIKKLPFLPFGGLTLQKESHIILMEFAINFRILRTFLTVLQ